MAGKDVFLEKRNGVYSTDNSKLTLDPRIDNALYISKETAGEIRKEEKSLKERINENYESNQTQRLDVSPQDDKFVEQNGIYIPKNLKKEENLWEKVNNFNTNSTPRLEFYGEKEKKEEGGFSKWLNNHPKFARAACYLLSLGTLGATALLPINLDAQTHNVEGYGKSYPNFNGLDSAHVVVREFYSNSIVKEFDTDGTGYFNITLSGINEEKLEEEGIKVRKLIDGVELNADEIIERVGLFNINGSKVNEKGGNQNIVIPSRGLSSGIYFVKILDYKRKSNYESSKIIVADGKVLNVNDKNLVERVNSMKGLRGGRYKFTATHPDHYGPKNFYHEISSDTSFNFHMITEDTTLFGWDYFRETEKRQQQGLTKWGEDAVIAIDSSGYGPITLDRILDTLPDAINAHTKGTVSGNNIALLDTHKTTYTEDTIWVFKVNTGPFASASSVSGNIYILNAGIIKLPNGVSYTDIWNEAGHAGGRFDSNEKIGAMNNPTTIAYLSYWDQVIIDLKYGVESEGFEGMKAGNTYVDDDPVPNGW